MRALAALLVAIPFVIAALLAGCTHERGAENDESTTPASEAPLSLEEGRRLAAERGVPVLVDFWAPT